MISSAILQWLAVIAMTIDHIGYYFCNDFLPLRIIGRIAMPIFLFFIVEGFFHTRSRSRYFIRLLICALAAFLPHWVLAVLMHAPFTINAVFTLALAFLAIACLNRKGWVLLCLIPIFALAICFDFEYGICGILTAVGFYYARLVFANNRIVRNFAQFLVLAAMNITLYLQTGWAVQLFAIAAIIPIAVYNGKKGHRVGGYFFYLYYPLHLFVMLATKLFLY